MNQYKQELRKKQDQLKEKTAECNKLYKQITNMRKSTRIKVSDHAMVRFLERVYKMNMEQLQTEILTPQVLDFFKRLGDGTYPIADGAIRVVIKDGVVVTILT
jgi:hypothetical protein